MSYALSTFGDAPPTTGWQETYPNPGPSQFVWSRTVITLNDDSNVTSYSVGKIGEVGPAGISNYSVLILSTEGDTFKNGVINTVLKARVYYGDKDITDELDANRFRWTRSSSDKVADQIWNAKYFGGVKEIQITTEDVHRRATFNCDLLGIGD